MRRLTRTLAVLGATVAAAALVVACDTDDYFYGGPSTPGFFPGRPPVDAGATTVPPGPCELAREDDSCSSNDRYRDVCEEKELANAACNASLRCSSGYAWTRTAPDRDACATDCPAVYTASAPEGTCAVPNAGSLICEYPEGTCGCAPLDADGDAGAGDAGTKDGGPKEAGAPDGGLDGGSDAGPRTYVWRCVKPAEGCPRTRPAEGEACVKPMTCNYGDCVLEDGVQMRCYSQRWVVEKDCGR